MEEINVVYKDVESLIPAEYNPRKISAKQEEGIRKSLINFGFVSPLVVNVNEERKNIVIGGHQRLKVAKKLGFEKVPCVEVNLDIEKEKELNLRLNKNQGEFDFNMLSDLFEKDLLYDVGFSEKEIGKSLSEFEKNFENVSNDECIMPIVPKFNEKYGCVIITFKSELDEAFLLNYFQLQKAKDYKNTRMGVPYIITVEEFQHQIEESNK